MSSRRVNPYLWGCSLEDGFRKYRFEHRCTCSPCGYGVLPFFRCMYGSHNFVQGKTNLLSLGVRRIGFRNLKRASRSHAKTGLCWGLFGDFFGLLFVLVFMLVFEGVLGAFWVAFGAQNGAQNRPQDGQKGVLEPTSEKHRKIIRNSTPET